jgi:hypothetical protein
VHGCLYQEQGVLCLALFGLPECRYYAPIAGATARTFYTLAALSLITAAARWVDAVLMIEMVQEVVLVPELRVGVLRFEGRRMPVAYGLRRCLGTHGAQPSIE